MQRAWFLVAVFVIAVFASVAPSGAQSSPAFGTFVRSGDSDASKTLRDAGSPAICRIDFGSTGDFTDDGFYVVWDGGATIDSGSLRLVQPKFATKGPGTLVLPEDSAEVDRAAASDHCDTTPSFCLGDADGSDTLTPGDLVFVTAGASSTDCVTAPDSTTTPDGWSARLTASGGQAAGTLVFAGHADQSSYGPAENNKDITGAEITYHDADASSTVTTGDLIFLASSAVSTGSTLPANSIRLYGGPAPTTTTTTTAATTTTTAANTTITMTTTTTTVAKATTTTPVKKDGGGATPALESGGLLAALLLSAAVIALRRRF